jgi:hypothetical protein
MSDQNLSEVWQVEVAGQIYEAPFEELGEWIGEGSLQPEDKVRKGNLRWIEARRVPSLVPFFNAKAKGLPMPLTIKTTVVPVQAAESPISIESVMPAAPIEAAASPVEHSLASDLTTLAAAARPSFDPNFCSIHLDVPRLYICDGCGQSFCKGCPKSFGGTVKVCPSCGELCRSVDQVAQKQEAEYRQATAISEGFGIADFFSAVGHPFKYKSSLFLGAVMFTFFSLGQSAAAVGGIFMVVSALFCVMLANMLTFGVLANTVDNFSQGNLEANFMPNFDDFSIWDDVLHPFFLSVGAYLVSFGPFIVTLVIGFYMVMNAVSSQMDTFQSEVEKLPGTPYYAGRKTVEQSEQVKDVLHGISEDRDDRLGQYNEAATGNSNSVIDQDAKEQEELWAMAQESRRVQLESAFGKTKETRDKEYNEMVQGFLGLAAPLVVIGAIFFLWGAFFFPAACAVAAYTRSFFTTINPLVGLDTIKRLGASYVKILLMGLTLIFSSAVVGGLFGAILTPFELPGFGNLPAKAIGAMFGFYLSVVFSCILGYAMFKNADKLDLLR